LFPNSPIARKAFENLQPFQVYASWNALAVMDPRPLLPPHDVRFRRGREDEGECAASECGLVCQDYWKAGFGRVLVVPSVQVCKLLVLRDTAEVVQMAYSTDVAKKTIVDMEAKRESLGWVDGVPPRKLDTIVDFDVE
jgi:alpha-1,3-mannosyltransferase